MSPTLWTAPGLPRCSPQALQLSLCWAASPGLRAREIQLIPNARAQENAQIHRRHFPRIRAIHICHVFTLSHKTFSSEQITRGARGKNTRSLARFPRDSGPESLEEDQAALEQAPSEPPSTENHCRARGTPLNVSWVGGAPPRAGSIVRVRISATWWQKQGLLPLSASDKQCHVHSRPWPGSEVR